MKDTELTEQQFNDILQTMWMANISIEGMSFDVYSHHWDKIVDWTSQYGSSSGVRIYDSDFGTVMFKKVK